MAGTATIAGMGLAAHRRAYNVLYADGSVRPYGDPQESLAWHVQGRKSTSSGFTAGIGTIYSAFLSVNVESCSGNKSNGCKYGVFAVSASYRAGAFAVKPYDVWHTLDMHGGFDVDAEVP